MLNSATLFKMRNWHSKNNDLCIISLLHLCFSLSMGCSAWAATCMLHMPSRPPPFQQRSASTHDTQTCAADIGAIPRRLLHTITRRLFHHTVTYKHNSIDIGNPGTKSRERHTYLVLRVNLSTFRWTGSPNESRSASALKAIIQEDESRCLESKLHK